MLLLPASGTANADTTVVEDLCREHAKAVSDDIRKELFNNMTAVQQQKALSLISTSCMRQFCARENKQTIVTETIEESSDDWFTCYLLEGKATDKPGNRRLERMRRK